MKFLVFKFFAVLVSLSVSVCFVPEITHEPDIPESRYVERYFKPLLHVTTTKETRCLTQAIYYEAGNQSAAGKEAVAVVVLNRVSHQKYPKTICGVVRQSHVVNERKICQFSFWCEVKRKPMKDLWEESEQIAKRVLQNYWERDILLQLGDAMFFHADYVRPKWRHDVVFVGKVDNHLFYKERS